MELTGKNVLVVGLARSGMAAIKVLHRLGAVITLSESKRKRISRSCPSLRGSA